MPRVFVTADLHFSHSNVITYEDRPFNSVEEMNKAIIKNWNSVVKNGDAVYVLGDVAFCNKEETKGLIGKLNGDKFLILGNHDKHRGLKYWSEVGFLGTSRYPIVYGNNIIMSHYPFDSMNEDKVYKYIYGHVHGSKKFKTITKNSACVSLERWNYKPVLLDTIERMWEDIEC